MKIFVSIIILVSMAGCGPGLRARSPQAHHQEQMTVSTELDAFETDDKAEVGTQYQKPEQLEFNFGDEEPKNTQQTNIDSQPELPLETDKPQTQDQPKEEVKGGSSEHKPLHAAPADFSAPVLLKPTIYYLPTNEVAPFKACRDGDIRSFTAMNDAEIVPGKTEIRVCSKFYFAVQMEGSGLIKTHDGQTLLINYVDTQGGVPRFKIVDRDVCPYGLGKGNLCLQPFISIAADRSRYNVGDVIYVPAVAKAQIRLPDGDIHKGYFIVTDTGGAINGMGRFDFYTGPLGELSGENPFQKIGLQSKSNTTHLTYQRVARGSQTEKAVQEYYKGRQIIPYK